jgi:Protein of unknown function (DUF1822)
MTQSPEFVDFLDTEVLTDEQIELSPTQREQAAQQSHAVTDPSQQWQIYMHALALVGFKEWLAEWATDLEIDESRCSLFQLDQFIAVCHFSVAKFDLCLIAVPLLLESTVSFPKAVIDLCQFAPHIYALVEVDEEYMRVKVHGYLRQDQLLKQQQLHPLESISAERYAVPLNWFNPDPTALLLELRCLKPYPIRVLQPSPQAINVGHWLSDRLDDAARQLGWMLLPPLVPAAALRSAQEDLMLLGVRIPSEARGVYRELQLGNAMLRFQAVTWVLSAASDTFAWTLLIILDGDRLPMGTHLRIRDASQLLFEQVVKATNSSLFAQVGGDLADRFWVTIDLPDGASIDLSPFYFGLDE